MSIEERVTRLIGEAVARQSSGDTMIELPSVAEIAGRGQRRNRLRRSALSVVGALLLTGALATVGTALREGPTTDLAAGEAETGDYWLQVPVQIDVDGDRFVALATSSPLADRPQLERADGPDGEDGPDSPDGPDGSARDATLVLLSSADGQNWEPIDDSELSGWMPPGDDDPRVGQGGFGFTTHEGVVHLLITWAEPGESGAAETSSDGSQPVDDEMASKTLSLAWYRFDLESQTWTSTVHHDLVDIDRPDLGVRVVGADASALGVIIEIALAPDPFAQALKESGVDRVDVCGVDPDSTMVMFRQCGSAEIIEAKIPLSATARPQRAILVGDHDTSAVRVVREFSYVASSVSSVYGFDDGLGIATDAVSGIGRSTDPVGETTDGVTWSDQAGSIYWLYSVAARGDERVALDSPQANRLGPDRSIRVLWYSESGELDAERTHVVAGDDTVERIRAAYRLTNRQLEEANPSVDLEELVVGQNLTIPDTHPSSRAWTSVDLEPVFGSGPMSSRYFAEVYGGPGGFLVPVAEVPPDHDRPDLDETWPFEVEYEGLVFAGHTPFGPATLRSVDGEVLATWDHFEVGNPDRHASIDLDRDELVIDLPRQAAPSQYQGPAVARFGLDEWLEQATSDFPLVTTDVLWSGDGLEWTRLATVDGFAFRVAVGDGGAMVLVAGARMPEPVYLDFPD